MLKFIVSTWEKIIVFGDFNVDTEEKNLKCFCDNYNLNSLIKQATYYKNPDSSTWQVVAGLKELRGGEGQVFEKISTKNGFEFFFQDIFKYIQGFSCSSKQLLQPFFFL